VPVLFRYFRVLMNFEPAWGDRLIIMQIIFGEEYKSWISPTFPLPCYLVLLRSRYVPQQPVR
jgi:hypothetical protein